MTQNTYVRRDMEFVDSSEHRINAGPSYQSTSADPRHHGVPERHGGPAPPLRAAMSLVSRVTVPHHVEEG
jgi:hypothetical protein